MQSTSYSSNELNNIDDADHLSDYGKYNPHASIPQTSLIQPTRTSHTTQIYTIEALSTPQNPRELSPHTTGRAISALDPAMSPDLRRQILASTIASCTPEELLFISETVAPLLKRDFLYQLPVELALLVLSFIDDPRTLVRASQVCKYWYRVVRDDSIWRRMCALHGFDDCEQAEREFQRTEKRRQANARRKEWAKKLLSDEEKEQESEERRQKHSSRPVEYSYRRHFKNSYIIRTNWMTGGKLLKAHHLPIVSPDVGTVTSLAIDSDWVVVGFANSMIKIFSADKGVLCRTLVGHKSGVWSVCLVSEGGFRLPDPMSPPHPPTANLTSSSAHISASAITGESVEVSLPPSSRRVESSARPRRRSSAAAETASPTKAKTKSPSAPTTPKVQKGKASKDQPMPSSSRTAGRHHHEQILPSSSSSAMPDQIAKLSLRDGKDAGPVKASRPKDYGISTAMEKALGIEYQCSEEEQDSSQSSSTSSPETPNSYAVSKKEQARRERMKQRINNLYSETAQGTEHLEDREEFRDLDANGTVSRSGSSRGWGQPNAIIVSGGSDKTVRVWDAISGQCIYILDGHSSTIRTMRVLHNRPIAVSGSRDATVRVWDIQLGRCLRVLEGHAQSVRCLDVSGNKVVSGSYDNTCRLWDIDTGQCIHVLEGHLHQVYSVAFDGVRIASGGLDTTVRIWDAETGQCVALLQGHTALVCEIQLSPTILATGGSDGRVIAFSLATYQVLYRLTPHTSSVTSLQLNEHYLVTGGNDGRVKLYETQTGKFIRELSAASDNVWKVAFGKETCAVMCKRNNQTVVEIWGLGPHVHRRTKAKERFLETRKHRRHGDAAGD